MTEPARRAAKQERKAGVRGTEPRTERYLIAPAPGYLLPPFLEPIGETVVDRLRDDRDVRIVRVIHPVERPGPLPPPVVVAVLPAMVHLDSVKLLSLAMPPPLSAALPFVMVTSLIATCRPPARASLLDMSS